MKKAANTDLRFVRTEKALINAIKDLLAEKDFNAITINDICTQASVSRTAFYQHYEDKYALAEAWVKIDIKPPSHLFTDDTLEEYFERLLEAEQTYRSQVIHLIRPDSSRELQWRIIAMWSEGFLRYYKQKRHKGARFEVPLEMMAIYNCTGVVNLIWWGIMNNYCFPKQILISYIVRKVRQSNDLIHF